MRAFIFQTQVAYDAEWFHANWKSLTIICLLVALVIAGMKRMPENELDR